LIPIDSEKDFFASNLKNLFYISLWAASGAVFPMVATAPRKPEKIHP
jgi:hypothetical protein